MIKKLMVLIIIGAAGFIGYRVYQRGIGGKTEDQLFKMIGEETQQSIAEGELLLRVKAGKLTAPSIRAELKSEKPKVRAAACRLLGVLKDTESAPQLIAILNDDKEDPEVKEAACKAFVDIRVKEAVPPLLKQLDHQRMDLRQAASEALRSITGENLSNKQADGWRLWWDQNKNTFEVKAQ